jgi:hypothetical protein
MTVTPAQVAALRAALDGDEEAFIRLNADPEVATGQGLPVLMSIAFIKAARRHFPPGWSGGDVVRLVGRLRARNQGAGENLSATAAEQVLLSALNGKPAGGQVDELTKSLAQFVLLAELVRDLSEKELSIFLAEAREQADAWLVQNTATVEGYPRGLEEHD